MALQVLYSTVSCTSLPVVWSTKFELVCHVIVWELSFKAYSSDLRWRMVYQRCILELPCTEVARNLNVDPSTVYRTVQLFEETGTVCSIQGYRESPFKKLTPHDEFAILDVISWTNLQLTSRMFSNTCCKPLALMCALQHSACICKVQDLHERSWH